MHKQVVSSISKLLYSHSSEVTHTHSSTLHHRSGDHGFKYLHLSLR